MSKLTLQLELDNNFRPLEELKSYGEIMQAEADKYSIGCGECKLHIELISDFGMPVASIIKKELLCSKCEKDLQRFIST